MESVKNSITNESMRHKVEIWKFVLNLENYTQILYLSCHGRRVSCSASILIALLATCRKISLKSEGGKSGQKKKNNTARSS